MALIRYWWRILRRRCILCGVKLAPRDRRPETLHDVYTQIDRRRCRTCNKRILHAWNYGARLV